MEDLGIAASTNPDPGFWKGKRVLLTGHTGFKGAWLAQWLHRLKAEVTSVALPPDTAPNLYSLARVGEICTSRWCDIRDAAEIAGLVKASRPDVVFHLAAQALVRVGYEQPAATFASNVMGTAHVLDALRGIESVRVAIMVTTDKVYSNKEWFWPYREDDQLGGHDPYSASKAAAEIVIASYRDAFLAPQGTAVASARAGNVIGGGDWSKDRLIPDAIRAWQDKKPLALRRPEAIRPWQHILEPLAGYLTLAAKLWNQPSLAGAYNFGPETGGLATVREVISLARDAYGVGEVHYECGDGQLHETTVLALEIAKARELLGVRSRLSLKSAVTRTMDWYRAQRDGTDARSLCDAEIESYEALA